MIVEFKDLLSVADIINSSVKEYQGERYYLTTGNLSENGNVKLEKYSYKDKPSRANQNVKTNDIIVARMKNTNKVLRIKEDLQDIMVSTGFVVLRAKNEVIEPSYLELVLKSKMFQNQKDKYCKGATQKAINNKELSKIKIPILDKTSQSKLVNLCKKVTTLIQKRKAQIEALDQLTQSVFLEMFGDPVLNTKGWKKKKFDYFAKIDTVMIKDFTNYKNSPHIGIENIEKNTGRIINYQTVAKSNITSGKYLFTDKHIIYSKIRPYLNKVALPNFTGVCSADAYPILVHEGKISRYFFAYLLRSNAFLNHVSKNSERTNIPKVNKQQLLSFTGICPPFKLQLEFEEICIKIESYRKIFEKSLKELENNFNSLMQRAFKGELFIEEKVSNL